MLASRGIFACAAAVTGAALVDPLVEALSNAHVFGPGLYTDRSNADVIPALSVAAVFSGLFIVLAVQKILRQEVAVARWLRPYATQFSITSVRGLLPLIFAVQLAVLYSMETAEQLVTSGHIMGPTIWLGAPVLLSLAFHAAGCAVVTFGLSRLLSALTKRIVDVVRAVLQFVIIRRNLGSGCHLPIEPITISERLKPFIERLKGRAPPQPAV